MSEPKSFAAKRDYKEARSKQYSDGSTFPNIADDGLLTGPSVKTATQAEDAALLSDDDNKTLTTLEPPRKPPAVDESKKNLTAATVKKTTNLLEPIKTLKTSFVTNKDVIKTLEEQTKLSKPSAIDLPSKDNLLQKMRSRLTKQIERKPTSVVSSTTPSKPLDTSGAIEIPHDLILSSEIPPTPIASMETKEAKLDDHDLIAILEGNEYEIRENATEIEVCVGGNSTDEGIEEMQILILNQDELQQAKKEHEKEIARRQMESLPTFPKKKRRTPRAELPHTAASKIIASAEVKPPPIQGILPIGVTIKGQTTIRPIGTKSPQTAEEQESTQKLTKNVPDAKKFSVVRAPREKAKVSKEIKPAPLVGTSKISPVRIKTPPVSTHSLSKSTDLVDSLVSDWDDEPVPPQTKAEGPEQTKATEMVSKPILIPDTVVEHVPTDKFIVPMLPSSAETRRVIKRKIIWDPSDATVPFAALVKSNRSNHTPLQTTNRETVVPAPKPPMLRRRADSVAVRTFDDGPRKAVRKRAQTPEPALLTACDRKTIETVAENNNTTTSTTLDGKAKKRKKNEIERLLADEGAINMLYDVECEANQKDLLKNTVVDTSDEDEKLLAKTKIITDAVINQGKSPTEGTSQQGPRVRAKRAPTPSNQPSSTNTFFNADVVSPKPDSTNVTSSAAVTVTKKNNNVHVTTPLVGARKRKCASTLQDWDFVYNAKGGDDAMIIRRRSNSSYSSSCASPRRLSIEQSYESSADVSSTAVKPLTKAQSDDGFMFAKPPDKSIHPQSVGKPTTTVTASDQVKVDSSLLANMRGKLSKALKNIKSDPLDQSSKKNSSPPAATTTSQKPIQVKRKVTKPPMTVDVVDYVLSADGVTVKQEDGKDEATERQLDELKQISCTQNGEYMEIVLTSKGVIASTDDSTRALSDVFSLEAMKELTSVLMLFDKDPLVKAVLLMSSGEHFSRGLDVGHLIQPVQKRKPVAEEMSECLRTFLKTLISFNKPIVAAVHGDVLGMGVTILPVFDIVVVQTGSSFAAPYGHFGYLPEAMKAFTSCRTLKPKALTDLLLQGKRISAAVALDYGLVTESIQPDRFHERAHALVKKVASQSAQAMQSIKLHLRQEFLAKLDFVLALEQKKHTQQWTTPECQQKFKLFVAKGVY